MITKSADTNKRRVESGLTKAKVGSLLGLFQSEYFTIDMNMIYLNKRLEDGIHAYLVNKLYTWQDHEIDFYLPQLCFLLIRRKSFHLEKLILDKCTRSMTLFLKMVKHAEFFEYYEIFKETFCSLLSFIWALWSLIGNQHFNLWELLFGLYLPIQIFWCLKSYGQSEKRNKKSFEYVESLVARAERAMVNGTAFPDDSILLSTESIKEENEKKKLRSEYLAETLKFTNILVTVSLKLKKHKIDERKKLCKSYMHRLNKWLIRLKKKHANDKYYKNLFQGIQLPFLDLTGKDFSNSIISIIADEISCFNTKKRVPYKIVVETIDMADFESYEPKYGEKEKAIINEAMQEVDNWDDIDLEREALRDEALANKVVNDDDKYGALVNFNKIAQEEAQKIKDQRLLKEIDLSEKLQQVEFQRQRTGTSRTTTIALALGKQNLLFEEEKFDLNNLDKSTRRSTKFSYTADMNEIHNLNLEQFNSMFPLSGHIRRRKSIGDQPKERTGLKRKLSFQHMSISDTIKNLMMFRCTTSHLMNINAEKIDKIINDLSNQSNEDAPKVNKKKESQIENHSDAMKFGPWDELWEYKKQLIRQKSPFGHFPSYKLRCLIVKGDDDLRQELITMQLIKKIEVIWKEAGLTLRLRTYDILVTSEDSGILEFVPDTFSIDGLKKKVHKNLRQFYEDTFGYNFEEAQKNFIDSLSAYSLICYFLQIKDRHNGNILIDAHGYLVHIDFGFILTISPGGINFESAPFKLTQEYVELIGGIDSDTYIYFKLQLLKGFMELRKHVESIVYMLQIMMDGSDLPCFENFDIYTFRERFREKSTDRECMEFIERLVDNSYDNWRTVQYDNFQKMTNNIMPQ